MYHTSLLFCLFGTLGPVLSGAIPQITHAPEKRDQAAMGLNLGGTSEFDKTTNAPTATGQNIGIYPTDAQDIPDDGAYFVFGPDITKDMLDSVGGDCAKLDDPKCQASLDKIFGNDDNNLVGRNLKQWFRLGKAIGSVRNVFVGAIAFLTIKWKANGGHLDDGQGLKLHLPSSALSVIQGASTATRVAYKTADNDPSAVTANIPASATASHGSEGLFTILDADANGHQKGDIALTASSDNDANALNDYYKKEGICPAGPKKRGIQVEKRVPNVAFDVDCIVNDVQNILDGMEGNGPLGGYREQMMQLAPMADPPNWASEVIDGAWRQVLVYAGGRMPNALGIRNEQVPAATRAVFFLAIAQNHAIKMVTRSLYIEAQGLLIEKSIYLKCPDKNNKWFPKCDNFVCQGKDGKCTTNFLKPCECNGGDQIKCPAEVDKRAYCNTCDGQGGKCTSGDQKGCQCIGGGVLISDQFTPEDWPDTLQKVLAAVGDFVPGSDAPTTSPKCDMDRASFVLNRLFRATPVYAKFCEAVAKDPKSALTQIVDDLGDVKPTKNKLKRTPPVDPSADDGNTYSLEWTGGDGSCPSGCKESYYTIGQSPCANLGGEQNLIAQHTELDTTCGIYKVTVNPPPGTDNKVPSVKASEITCKKFDDAIYHKCFQDIQPSMVNDTSSAFAGQLGSDEQKKVGKDMRDITQVYRAGGGSKGVTYLVNIHWIQGCTAYDKMVVDNPISGKSGQGLGYSDIFWTIYNTCGNNGNHGLGGFQDYGCLRYAFAPTNVPGTWAAPPHPEYAFKATDGRGDLNICDPKCLTPDTCPIKHPKEKNGVVTDPTKNLGCDSDQMDDRCTLKPI